MKEQKIIATTAILNTFSDIPTPGPNAQRITALIKHRGRIVGYQLSNGQEISKEEGVSLAKRGGIMGVGIGTRKGMEYLKALPDGTERNNLSSLPSV